MLLPVQDEVVSRRLSKAGTSLVIRLPFFGYLLFGSGTKVMVDDETKTLCTDGVNIYVGREFILKEDIDLLMFGLLHELIHVYFCHPSRRGDRDKKVWNIAVDIFTNGQCSVLLGSMGTMGDVIPWPVPKRFIQPESWASGLTVEQIYDFILQQQKMKPDFAKSLLPGDGEIGDGDDIIDVPAGIPDPQDDKTWQEVFRSDVAHAKALSNSGPSLKVPVTDAVKSRMDKIMRASLPWGSLLRGDLTNDLGFDELSYAPPKMKYYPLILPQTLSKKERVLVLLVDVSASVTDELIRIFVTNVQAAAMSATETVIITFDEVVRENYKVTNPYKIFSHVKFMSGYHTRTSAIHAFELAVAAKPSAICCLTDGYIDLPPAPVPKTTFVIPEGGRKQSWGRHYVMEHPWR